MAEQSTKDAAEWRRAVRKHGKPLSRKALTRVEKLLAKAVERWAVHYLVAVNSPPGPFSWYETNVRLFASRKEAVAFVEESPATARAFISGPHMYAIPFGVDVALAEGAEAGEKAGITQAPSAART